ncbi:unnamed protein product [Cyprideis torosa]|uniref:Uncharacterized protein n=1 Tax=Cyprideis torosa TaxID=163714 RepID=A0A7R8ZNV7_9CRUS|nr:unnamed protein product [Cyprideis torosa]CAG0888510.1 unnamed protein product [Cyprideis torosa]
MIDQHRYIRYIYNRVILEAAAIRAAAVSALARFGALCEDLLPNILVLLSRCMMDDDDEVRDRACYFHAVLEQHNKALNLQYILEGLQVSLSGLERALSAYTLSPSEVPFDLRSVPLAATEEEEQDAKRKRQEAAEGVVGITAPAKKEDRAATRQDVFAEKLSALPMCKDIGPLFRSSAPVELTESETEYVVSVIKHVFRNHIVLQVSFVRLGPRLGLYSRL